MVKSRKQTCFTKKFSITLSTNENTRAFFISTLASLLKRANEYVGKLPEQHFSVWLFSNPGDQILFLLKLSEARASEWNLSTSSSNLYQSYYPHRSRELVCPVRGIF